MDILEATKKQISPLSQPAMKQAQARWDSIAKPLHSLGRLEDAVIQIAGIQQTARVQIEKSALVVFCADNGVVEEGITQTGQEVTGIVAGNFLKGNTCTSIFCRDTGTEVYPIDIGMIMEIPGVEKRKSACGTKNMAKEPAMSYQQAVQAIETGILLARERKEQGYQLLIAGEMGIGNTTTSSAAASVLTGIPAGKVTGRGAGLSKEGLERKKQVIEEAIEKHQPMVSDPVDVLAKVGGFDLAGMTGFYLGAAALRMPVILDGLISQTAALAAVRLCPAVSDYLLASHKSAEPAGGLLLEALEKRAVIDGGLFLGEGSGAVLYLQLLKSAVRVYEQMSTFSDIQIEAYEEL